MKTSMLITLTTPKIGPMATRLPSRFARTNAALIANLKIAGLKKSSAWDGWK